MARTVADSIDEYGRDAGRARAAIVQRFVKREGWHEDASSALRRHLGDLEAEGLRPSSVDQVYRTVRAFYRRVGLKPPRVPGHHYDPRDARRPALSPETVAELVAGARAGRLMPHATALLALSTTYGMRAIELSRVSDRDVDAAGERIFIRTAKGGPPRWCWLPPEISSQFPTAWPRTSPAKVEAVFREVWDGAIEGDKPLDLAWHSLRRSLNVGLADAGVSEGDRRRFGRWAGGRDMAQLYAEPNLIVGPGSVRPTGDEASQGRREFDRAVWDAHPFTPLWR